jgi:glyoxylase-like metal-dependent hydrolase (beta-lactamase superfamily II)
MLEQLTDRIFYLPFNDATDRPNLGYVLGTKQAFAVDAGNSPKHAGLFLDQLSDHRLPVPAFVGLTHWHWDHTYGMAGFPCSHTVACTRTNEYLQKMMAWNWDDASMKERVRIGEDIKFCDTHIRREYPDPLEITIVPADILFDTVIRFNLGSVHCEMRRIENSHSDDCCVVYVPEEKFLFAGDIYGEDFHHGWPPKHYPEKLAILLDELDRLDFTMALPGHAGPESKDMFLTRLKKETERR